MIRIVADSGAHLPPEVREELDIATIPLLVIFGSHSYRDEVDLTNEQFYEKLRHEKVHPTTSTPAPADFIHVWRPIIMAGDEIVCITLPS
ncbi:MAG: DegV family protein, partial [Rudaea sp.]